MVWKIELSSGAEKALGRLGAAAAKRVAKGLLAIAELNDPRLRGKAMVGIYAGYWRYRFGDYRVIARIEDGQMIIVVIAVGHRREVYR